MSKLDAHNPADVLRTTGRDEAHRVFLNGLDGSNLLAYLAAMGLLRVTAEIYGQHAVRLGWRIYGGRWLAVLYVEDSPSRDELLQDLDERLSSYQDDPAFVIDPDSPWNNLKASPEDFRSFAQQALRQAGFRDDRIVAFLAAFGTDAFESKDGFFLDTDLRTMRGSGHQHFLKFMRQLVDITDESHIESALFSEWSYSDDKPSMRWDPEDDRRHAFRAENPSSDPITTVRGANRLAVEGLPYFVVIPRETRTHTRGFLVDTNQYPPQFSWPIWRRPITSVEYNALVRHPAIYASDPDSVTLNTLGVAEIYRSRRINTGGGRYRNFTPAKPVLGTQR